MESGSEPAADPLSDLRCHGIPDRMISQTVLPVGIELRTRSGRGPIDREALNAFYLCSCEPPYPAIWIPDIVPAPIRAGVPGTLSIDTVGQVLYEGAFASISNDDLKLAGRFLPIRSVRRRIPVAAFGLKKYFSGTSCVSMHGNNEDSTALLGDSEVFAVKHTPCDTIPEPVQRLEYDGEVSSSVAREKAVHVFEDNGSWHTSSNEADKLVK